NRLRSIQADAAFVSEISNLFPQFPVIANERCGTWYVHPSKIHKPGVYFKSTDGHTGIWDFNLRRYNPHLITTIIKHGGCIIVDSTRKGKRVPDALSKTIPIWCATINNAVRKCALQNQAAHESSGEAARWDTRYHSLPSLISRSEHVQIADKIEGFAEKLMASEFTDMTPLTTKLLKPIRPIWLTPQSFLLRHDLPDYSQCAFLPVICLSASRVVQDGMEERDGYLYVQGSGDDEEMWSKGLKPELLWENEEYLLEEGISPAECEQRAEKVVKEAKRKMMEKSKHRQEQKGGLWTWYGRRREGSFHAVNGVVGRIPDCWDAGFDMVINCGAEIKRHTFCESTPMRKEDEKDYYYLHLPIAEGKKGQHQLLEMIPMAIKAVHLMFAANNKDSKAGQETRRPRILVHCQQGMDRSVGISLALLVSCFDETTGAYSSGGGNDGDGVVKATASKELIQRRLFQIMSHRLAARPSRATLKMVNTFFMSPTDPPPAKYKS
ncbi:MAG: tRNA A64-2'-O-ribosylphosphate transferase, partial [Linnemannia elongata]